MTMNSGKPPPSKINLKACSLQSRALLKTTVKSLSRQINLTLPTFITTQKLKIPLVAGVGLSNVKHTEPWMLRLMEMLFSQRKVTDFIDIGANVGQTYIKLRSLYPTVRYVGFEPNPTCVDYLEKLFVVNQDFNAVVIPSALGKKSGLLRLFHSSSTASDATTVEGLRSRNSHNRQKIVTTLEFDSLYDELNLGDGPLVKIDVEGGELEVLQGMTNFICEQRPLIICEVLHADTEEKLIFVRERNTRLQDLLNKMGYLTYQICKPVSGEGRVRLSLVNEFSEGVWNPNSSPAQCDYILSPVSFSH